MKRLVALFYCWLLSHWLRMQTKPADGQPQRTRSSTFSTRPYEFLRIDKCVSKWVVRWHSQALRLMYAASHFTCGGPTAPARSNSWFTVLRTRREIQCNKNCERKGSRRNGRQSDRMRDHRSSCRRERPAISRNWGPWDRRLAMWRNTRGRTNLGTIPRRSHAYHRCQRNWAGRILLLLFGSSTFRRFVDHGGHFASQLASARLSAPPTLNAVVVPARQTYSHSASVGKR